MPGWLGTDRRWDRVSVQSALEIAPWAGLRLATQSRFGIRLQSEKLKKN